MKIALRVLLLAVLIALGVWLWGVLFPGPERIIRRRLAEVARTVSVDGHEGLLARGAFAQKLTGFIANDTEIILDVPGRIQLVLSGRDEIIQAAIYGRSTDKPLQIEFLDPNVVLAPDQQSAVVDLTIRARIPGERDFIVQEAKFTFKKVKREWLIIRVETVKTLSRASGSLLTGARA